MAEEISDTGEVSTTVDQEESRQVSESLQVSDQVVHLDYLDNVVTDKIVTVCS